MAQNLCFEPYFRSQKKVCFPRKLKTNFKLKTVQKELKNNLNLVQKN